MAVAFFSATYMLRSRWLMLGVLAAIVLVFAYISEVPLPKKLEYGLVYTDMELTKLINFMGFFQVGVVFKLFEKEIKLNKWLFWACLAGIFAMNMSGIYWLQGFRFLLYGVVVFYLSYVPLAEKYRYPFGRNDYSYGIYIYGMPVQQLIIFFLGTSLNIYLYTVLCLLAVLPMAMFSWHYVEKPMLSFKPKAG